MDARLRDRLGEVLAAKSELQWAYVFGSAVDRDAHRDVDIAVMPVAGSFDSLVELGRLQIDLAKAAGCEVDLIDLRRAPLHLLGSILRRRLVVLDRCSPERHAWEARMGSRWLDFEPARARASALRREKMALRTGMGG